MRSEPSNAESPPLPIVTVRESWQVHHPATTQVQDQGYEIGHPSLHSTYELLEHVKGANLQIPKCGISMTQDRVPQDPTHYRLQL